MITCRALQPSSAVCMFKRAPALRKHMRSCSRFTHLHVRADAAANATNSQIRDSVASRIRENEKSEDWIGTVEAFTEARILKLELPNDAVECGIRTLVNGEQHQKAIEIFYKLREQKHSPEATTTALIFSALAKSKESLKALELLQEIKATAPRGSILAVTNITVRALARDGHTQQAMDVLTHAVVKEDFEMDFQTFNTVAMELMRRGEQELAEEVLEMRDYL